MRDFLLIVITLHLAFIMYALWDINADLTALLRAKGITVDEVRAR